MMDKTKIEWADASANPFEGCSRVSEGCRNCYAEGVSARFSKPGAFYHGLAVNTPSGPRWTNEVRFRPEALLNALRWQRGRRIFAPSMSDPFHPGFTDEQRDFFFSVVSATRRHTWMVLTKRPEEMRRYFNDPETPKRIDAAVNHFLGWGARKFEEWPEKLQELKNACDWNPDSAIACANQDGTPNEHGWPIPNLWLGTSTEDQESANKRLGHLLATPAALRFVSVEPMLGGFSLGEGCAAGGYSIDPVARGLGWVICGGESGPNARPMHPDWVRKLRDECVEARVPFFFKQWGAYEPHAAGFIEKDTACYWGDGTVTIGNERKGKPNCLGTKKGKKSAGRVLDGRTWDEIPERRTA